MEKDKNKNQSILTKNNVDSNKKENETPIKSDKKKSESENFIIKNKSIDNTSGKIYKLETNSKPIEQKLLNNKVNYLALARCRCCWCQAVQYRYRIYLIYLQYV